ncbi:hypothetical protein, partial [Paraburkholderia sediminicola]|uniref:hypothetical protein n=1 Tax=Paraburkholderia sediminicola TaxID=458836 RepID=UPI0038B902B0
IQLFEGPKARNQSRHARYGDELSAQFYIVVSCSDIAYSCNAEYLFRRYCDRLVGLQSIGKRSAGYYLKKGASTLTGTGTAPLNLFPLAAQNPEI